MSISGTSTICNILTNSQFQTSGLTATNLSTINITDDNGLDVSECFGITTNIITVGGSNVTLTGNCDTSLEIQITQGVSETVSCDFSGYTIQQDGIILFEFPDGTTNTNIHPDCCLSIGYTPEISDIHKFYICRANDIVDPNDCSNYTPIYSQQVDTYVVFEFVTGGTTTVVPSVECCYAYGFVESFGKDGLIRCINEQSNPCEGYEVIEPVPLSGPISFTDPNGNETTIVPSSQCCTVLGYDFLTNSEGTYTCYQSNSDKPTVSFTNDPCCSP